MSSDQEFIAESKQLAIQIAWLLDGYHSDIAAGAMCAALIQVSSETQPDLDAAVGLVEAITEGAIAALRLSQADLAPVN